MYKTSSSRPSAVKTLTYTVEGLERYPVNLRYSRELRDNIDMLKGVLVTAPTGAHIPLAQLARISIHKGPARHQNGKLPAQRMDLCGPERGGTWEPM